MAAFRFSALPSSAVPNSLMRRVSRSLNGSRRVFWTRSGWTVVLLRAAGIGPVRGWLDVARLAVEEVLGDQGLRLRGAAGVRLELRESGIDLEGHERRLLRSDVEIRDGAGLRAGHPELGAVDQAEGVEELDLVGVAPGRAGAGDEVRRDDREQPEYQDEPLHGPSGVSVGLQSTVPPWVSGSRSGPARWNRAALEVVDAERAGEFGRVEGLADAG